MSQQWHKKDVVFLQRLLGSAGLYTGVIDGIWGPKTEAAVNRFETASNALADELGRFDSVSERNILTLQLQAQRQARLFMKRVRDAKVLKPEYTFRIISGTRTYAEQNKLYAQGRTEPGPIVTNAKGGQSNHNFGIAWDIGIFKSGSYQSSESLYNKVAPAGLVSGLEWGGNWVKFVDRPHYQLDIGLSTSAVRQRFEKGQPYIYS